MALQTYYAQPMPRHRKEQLQNCPTLPLKASHTVSIKYAAWWRVCTQVSNSTCFLPYTNCHVTVFHSFTLKILTLHVSYFCLSCFSSWYCFRFLHAHISRPLQIPCTILSCVTTSELTLNIKRLPTIFVTTSFLHSFLLRTCINVSSSVCQVVSPSSLWSLLSELPLLWEPHDQHLTHKHGLACRRKQT